MTDLFEAILFPLRERDRDHVLAAFAAVENSTDPVAEANTPALRDATLRRCVGDMLHLIGRSLIAAGPYTWTSGFRDDIGEALAADGRLALPEIDRAVLVVILVNSVAMPRSSGELHGDTWLSSIVTPPEVLRKQTQIAAGTLRESLERLRASGLIKRAISVGRGGASRASGYVPGPQFYRLTDAARRRLQEELILAAGPATPLAAAIRARRAMRQEKA